MVGKGEKFFAKKVDTENVKMVGKRSEEYAKRTGEELPETDEEKVAFFFQWLEDVQKDEKKVVAFKRMLYMRHIVRSEDVPADTVSAEGREVSTQEAQEKQKESLNRWIDYFVSDESASIPIWVKAWALNGVLTTERNPETHLYRMRLRETTEPFIALDKVALDGVMDVLQNRVEEGVDTDDTRLEKILEITDFALLYRYVFENRGEMPALRFMSKKELMSIIEGNPIGRKEEASVLGRVRRGHFNIKKEYFDDPEKFVAFYAFGGTNIFGDDDDKTKGRADYQFERTLGIRSRKYEEVKREVKSDNNLYRQVGRDLLVNSHTDWPEEIVGSMVKRLYHKLKEYVPSIASEKEKMEGWKRFIEETKNSLRYRPNEPLAVLEKEISNGRLPDDKLIRNTFIKYTGRKEPYEYAVIFSGKGFVTNDDSPYEDYKEAEKNPWGRFVNDGKSKKHIILVQCLWEDEYSEEGLKAISEETDIPAFSANGERL